MKKSNFWLLPLTLMMAGCSMDAPDAVQDMTKSEKPYLVDIEQAIETADRFFAGLQEVPGTRTHRVVGSIETYTRGNPLTRSSDTDPDFYVINYMNEGGFALVSADSRRLPVYAFSTEGHLSLTDTATNTGLRDYLSVTATMGLMLPDTLPPYQPIINPVTILLPPMLNKNVSHWDQLSLNKYVCPNPEDSIPVGCVALATAQIMSYYCWPNRWPVDGYATAREKYTFNWSEMLKTRVNDPTARLLEVLGRPENLNITHRKGGSGTFMSYVPPTMEKMGYIRPQQIQFNTDSAVNALYRRAPILMDGFPQNGGSGHAWTVDGLAQYELCDVYRLYFHFVWGNWGGGNGFFYFDESTKSFEEQARAFCDDEHGSGNINNHWKNIRIITDFKVDTSRL